MALVAPRYTPKYRHVARHIRELIKTDGLRPGDQLPTERDLARRLGVAYLTVRRANQELVDEGFIRREQGRGSFLNDRRVSSRLKTVGFLAVGVEMAAATLIHFRYLQQMLAPHGVRLVFDTVIPDADADAIPASIRSLDAVVVYGALDAAYLRRLGDEKIPVIVSSDTPPVPSMTVVHSNYYRFGYELTRVAATELGFDYVWLVIEALHVYYTRQIVAGYRQAVRDAVLKTEYLSLQEDDFDPTPFARSLSHARSMDPATRHAVLWMILGSFPALSVCGPTPAEGQLGVVRHGAQPRWTLPAPFDLGHIEHQSELFAQATADAIRAVVIDGVEKPFNVLLEPHVKVEHASGGPRVTCDWSYEIKQPQVQKSESNHSSSEGEL